MNVAVDPAYRRRGIASRLMHDLFERADRDRPFTLEVRVSNAGAIALYERYGFKHSGIRPRYYNNAEDALIMWRPSTHDYEQTLARNA
jgi:ribosomal-protein-alanine N-acetyltransferase